MTGDSVGDMYDIRVPASVANLGPGFDVLAVAVQLYLRLRANRVEGRGELRFHFVDSDLVGENYIERAFHHLASRHGRDFPSLDVEVHCEIPIRSGLGSSAAATIAGLRLYDAAVQPVATQELLNAAVELEGHPDNVAAALLGGLTASCALSDGSMSAVPLQWPSSLRLIVATPKVDLSTSKARGVLPKQISRHDAVFNLQHLAHLLHALQAEDFELLREAMADRLHQPHREHLMPGLEQALSLQHPDLLGVCLSGAGPSIVCFATRNCAEIEKLLSSIYRNLALPFTVRTLSAHRGDEAQDHRMVSRQEPGSSVLA